MIELIELLIVFIQYGVLGYFLGILIGVLIHGLP